MEQIDTHHTATYALVQTEASRFKRAYKIRLVTTRWVREHVTVLINWRLCFRGPPNNMFTPVDRKPGWLFTCS